MENGQNTLRSKQELVEENKHFLAHIRAEDVEYTANSLSHLQRMDTSVTRHILSDLRKIDIEKLYYRPFPKDGGELRVGDTLFTWQIDYFDNCGQRITTYEQILIEHLVDRVVVILAPEDRLLLDK